MLPSVEMTPELVRGRSFFEMSCALCHGERGDGNGRFSMGQTPRPRDFRRAKFKFTTTTNQVPSDDDLVRLFRVGVPGATMPGYPQADRGELLAVAAYVRKLTADGVSVDLSREIASGTLSLDEAKRMLAARTTPGVPVVVPPEPVVDESRLANGKRVYLEACVKCHGADGTPDISEALFDEDGTRNIPRRFAQGYFKGGEEGALLFVRVLNGMPGTPMPSFKDAYSPADIWDVVHYLQRLSLHGKPRG